jgi:transcriptional regulator with XRE-family HTH domain
MTRAHSTKTPAALLGKRVRELRKQAHISQTDLGNRAGIDPGDLSRIENGHGPENIGIERIARLAKALGVRPGVLLDP